MVSGTITHSQRYIASDYVGHYQQLTGTLYFPGLFKSHSLKQVTIASQTSDYIFYKNLNLIEGYDHSKILVH